MKYKAIRAMSHNWTHSFMSGMNYIDGRFVYQDIYDLARKRKPRKVVISWIPNRTAELFGLTARVRKCIRYYRTALTVHLERHRIRPEALRELRTEVYIGENFHMYVRSYALDDRGKEHEAFVWT